MRSTRVLGSLLVFILALSCSAWTQGGTGRGATTPTIAPQGASAPQSVPAGRGSGRGSLGGAGGADGLFTFDATASQGMPLPDSQPIETRQKITINGDVIAYTARAGFFPLRNATTGQSVAHLFFTSYTRDGTADASARPLLVFLGGAPGVATAWQEFGGFGPKRMKWADAGTAGRPPYGAVENSNTLLAQADLVFVNPVGTSSSRPDQPGRGPEFWTTAGDTASMGEFVRGFLSHYDRRHSPLILAGEDAGTARAAAVAAYLIDHQTPVAGVVLLSMTPSADSIAGDAQYITMLPSQVLAAWHHKKLSPELQTLGVDQIAEQARQFAAREYLHALYKGDRMTADERTKVVASLSRLTGLSKAFIVNNDLRLPPDRFNVELLREERRALSVSDGRATGFVPATTGGGRGGSGGGSAAVVDYNQYNLGGGFLAAYESYLRRELNFPTNANGILYLSGGGIGAFASTGSDEGSLANAFTRNPRLRLFVAVSLFDLGVPFYATEFTLAHLNVSPEVRARNISVGHYEAGQMPYIDSKARTRLKDDLAKFITDTVARTGR
jgi:carboxypeptidase C (cathepsin A)